MNRKEIVEMFYEIKDLDTDPLGDDLPDISIAVGKVKMKMQVLCIIKRRFETPKTSEAKK